jgi:hypothetical protein
MKNFLIMLAGVVVLGAAIAAIVLTFNTDKEIDQSHLDQVQEVKELTEQEIISSSKEWVIGNSPTYLYDGSELNIQQVESLSTSLYQIMFSFKSSSAGYGDRSDLVSAQVITEHSIVVISNNGVVQSAITDESYDEINDKLIEEN